MTKALEKQLDRLIEQLDKEAEQIKSGNFEGFAKVLEKREHWVNSASENVEASSSELEEKWRQIFEKSQRNSKLIQAAMDGVKAVSEIVNAIKVSASHLNTYNKQGSVNNIAGKSTMHERKV